MKQDRLSFGAHVKDYLSEDLVWRLFINICLGLEHMHSKDILHRDLKTLNVFMTKDLMAKIGDFGFALNLKKPQIQKRSQNQIEMK